MKKYTALLEPLQHQARIQPDRTILRFLHDDESVTGQTNHQIWQRIQIYAGALKQTGIQQDDLVILVLPQSLELVYAFLGTVYLGAVPAVFAFLSPRMDEEIYRQRIQTLVIQSGAKCVITFPAIRGEMEAILSGSDCRVLTDEMVKDQESTCQAAVFSKRCGQDTAYVQYSSGTTGLQKGVAITHQDLLEQIEALGTVVNLQPDDIQVSWLPLNHDMGLMAGMLLPLISGIPLILMSPFTWVRSPAVLFRAIDQFHATHCYMPNFAYSHCTLNIRERDLEGLDLSHMRMFMNGGEPIYFETLTGFLKRFGPYGVLPEMLCAGYGLAEVSGAVSVTPAGQFPRIDWVDTDAISRSKIAQAVPPNHEPKMSIVSCGQLSPGAKVRIVDEAEVDLQERMVGEVLIGGSFTFKGYLQGADSGDLLHNDGWLRTGDLGYVADGELYICGRKKDMMIIGGQNFFPEYLEQAVLEISELRPGRAVVFGVEDTKLGTEMAVMVCELKKALPEDEQQRLIREIRRCVVLATDIALGDVRLVERGWIHKTSSGKLSRNLNREKYIKQFKER